MKNIWVSCKSSNTDEGDGFVDVVSESFNGSITPMRNDEIYDFLPTKKIIDFSLTLRLNSMENNDNPIEFMFSDKKKYASSKSGYTLLKPGMEKIVQYLSKIWSIINQ